MYHDSYKQTREWADVVLSVWICVRVYICTSQCVCVSMYITHLYIDVPAPCAIHVHNIHEKRYMCTCATIHTHTHTWVAAHVVLSVWMCAGACKETHMYMYHDSYKHTHEWPLTYSCLYGCVYVSIFVSQCTCACVLQYVCVYMCVCICVSVYLCRTPVHWCRLSEWPHI